MALLSVQIVSPERILFEGEAEMVVCRTTNGEIVFLPGHEPLIGSLGIAKVRAINGDTVLAAAVHRGFVEISHDRVTVLSDVAELADQIDPFRARNAKDIAEGRLRVNPDDAEAADALARAELRLEVAGAA